MIETLEDQVNLFDQDIWSGKTCQEPSQATTAKTSGQSSKKQQKSSKKMPLFLNLRKKDGTSQEPSWETDGASLGEYMMPSIGEFLKEENGFVSWQISTDQQRRTYYLTLNCSEMPRIPNPTKLSQIIEENPNPKYNLSQKACQGILNRAARRGKELPKELMEALIAQSQSTIKPPATEGGDTGRHDDGGGNGLGIGIGQPSPAISTSERHAVMSFQERAGKPGGAKEYSSKGNTLEPSQHSITNPSTALGLDAYNQQATGEVSMNLTAKRSDFHHVPTVMTNGQQTNNDS